MNDVSSGFEQVFAYCTDCMTMKGKKNPLFKFVRFLRTELCYMLALDSTSVGLQSSSKKNDFFTSVETQRTDFSGIKINLILTGVDRLICLEN